MRPSADILADIARFAELGARESRSRFPELAKDTLVYIDALSAEARLAVQSEIEQERHKANGDEVNA